MHAGQRERELCLHQAKWNACVITFAGDLVTVVSGKLQTHRFLRACKLNFSVLSNVGTYVLLEILKKHRWKNMNSEVAQVLFRQQAWSHQMIPRIAAQAFL